MIEAHEIEAAQESWGNAVVEVGAAPSWKEAHELAVKLVEDHYLFEGGTLLFCPTKAAGQQFRVRLKEAVSYFVGRDADHEEDKGFAREPWTSVRFENIGTMARGDVGIAMGNYFFGRADSSELKVEYSFVYIRGAGGGLKIQLHHSALPYQD